MVRRYFDNQHTGGYAGHPVCCVCPECAMSRWRPEPAPLHEAIFSSGSTEPSVNSWWNHQEHARPGLAFDRDAMLRTLQAYINEDYRHLYGEIERHLEPGEVFYPKIDYEPDPAAAILDAQAVEDVLDELDIPTTEDEA